MNKLINNLIRQGYLKTDSVIEAFSEINRVDFVSREMEAESESDVALPIGYGQTISQPATVAFMLEILSTEVGNNVLDIGSGSGWTTALLCHITGENGKVTAIERIPDLMKWGEKNVDKYSYLKKGIVQFHCSDGREGFSQNAPYDRILVSASCDSVPEILKRQLKVGGRMVLPIKNDLVFLEKKGENEFREEKHQGFAFVPLI
jgi:protein-L-isoaspartate(D-aspartate) O-methyltransferase